MPTGLPANSWPLPQGAKPEDASITANPPPSSGTVGGGDLAWTVPSGKLWIPLMFFYKGSSGNVATPNTHYWLVIESSNFGQGSRHIADPEACWFGTVMNTQPLQLVKCMAAVSCSSVTYCPADHNVDAYGHMQIPPMVCWPGDSISWSFLDGGGGTPTVANSVFAEIDYGAAGDQGDQPLLATPILA